MGNTVPWWATKSGAKAWDTLYLSGEAVPGLAKVTGKLSHKISKKSPKGSRGVIIRYEGYEPSEFGISLRIWTEIQLFDIQALIGRIRPKKGEAPTAFDVSHPVLELYDIRSIYVTEITFLEETAPGIYETRLSCLEFLPLPKGGGKSATTKAGPDIRTLDNPLANAAITTGEAFGNIAGLAGSSLTKTAKAAAEFFAPSNDPKKSGP